MFYRLRFTLVSEPVTEEEDEDCVELGFAYVSLTEILETGRDLIGAEIPSQQLNEYTILFYICLLSTLLSSHFGAYWAC